VNRRRLRAVGQHDALASDCQLVRHVSTSTPGTPGTLSSERRLDQPVRLLRGDEDFIAILETKA
jgi:hypothetical protein